MYNKNKLLRLIVADITLALKQNFKDQTGVNTHKHTYKECPILSHVL